MWNDRFGVRNDTAKIQITNSAAENDLAESLSSALAVLQHSRLTKKDT